MSMAPACVVVHVGDPFDWREKPPRQGALMAVAKFNVLPLRPDRPTDLS